MNITRKRVARLPRRHNNQVQILQHLSYDGTLWHRSWAAHCEFGSQQPSHSSSTTQLLHKSQWKGQIMQVMLCYCYVWWQILASPTAKGWTPPAKRGRSPGSPIRNDGEICVLIGPVKQQRQEEGERIFHVASDLIVPNTGCPVICHGLTSASHLNCKLGEVRAIHNDRHGIRLTVRFETKCLKPSLVKPEILRIAKWRVDVLKHMVIGVW
jgi:hypothetical protein